MEYNALQRNIGNNCYNNASYNGTITDGVYTRLSCAPIEDQLFILIEYYPLNDFISVITIIAIIGYFVTSSDSASYVIDLITSNGVPDTPKLQRIFWAMTEGAVATALLAAGGDVALEALQTVSIASAFPFTFLLILMVYGLIKAFNMDKELFARDRVVTFSQKGHNNNNNKQIIMLSTDIVDDNKTSYEKQDENDDESKQWKVEFFDALFSSFCVCLTSIFMPCIWQYRNGKKIGMYGKDLCNDIMWAIVVFATPVLFVLLQIMEIWMDGFAELAWVVYTGWVFMGVYHRLNI
eukprot:767537_1